MAGDGKGEVVVECLLGPLRLELLAEHEPPQGRKDLDVEQVRRGDVVRQRISTISPLEGPVERSRAASLATMSAFVGRAAILASSAPTYADRDLPSAAARSFSVSATSSDTSRM